MKLETSDLVGFVKQRQFGQVRALKVKPTLAIAVVGNEVASASFIHAKIRYGEDIGVKVEVKSVKTESELMTLIKDWNKDAEVTGIVVQLPLPAGFDTDKVLETVAPHKDIDGLGPKTKFEPGTAKAIMWILASLNLKLADSNVCVVGQGKLVGAPVSELLEVSAATVERCDIHTPDLSDVTKRADVVVSGAGRPGLIKRQMLKPGAIVIDAGTAEAAGRLAGDADPDLYDDPSVRVTPVPGGVGPMTVAALFDNLVIAAVS